MTAYTRVDFINEVDTTLTDGGKNTAAEVRQILTDLADSTVMPLSDVADPVTKATTSGTSITFSGGEIPSGCKRITVCLAGVSTNGTDNLLIQIGGSTIETTGYLAAGSTLGAAVASSTYTTGFGIRIAVGASMALHGTFTLNLTDNATDTWSAFGVYGLSDSAFTITSAGSKTLSEPLASLRLTTLGGVNTFDAGMITIICE